MVCPGVMETCQIASDGAPVGCLPSGVAGTALPASPTPCFHVERG